MVNFYLHLSFSLIAMKKAYTITSLEQTKLLADSRRMRILRLLMAAPSTLTKLSQELGQSPAWVRHHLQKLLAAGLVEPAEIRKTGTVTEKFYRAKGGAFLLQKTILPESRRPTILFAGSHDLAIEHLAKRLAPYLDIVLHPIGSLDGLINLHQGLCHLSGAHLLDKSGVYNIPYISRLFPQHNIRVVTLAYRVQGLMTAPNNPKEIRSISDLARPDIRFVNRNTGSGTRLWIDAYLHQQEIPTNKIHGYKRIVFTHTAAAEQVASGLAHAAIGLQAAARQFNLHFIPLFEERFDLVFPRQETDQLAPLLDEIQSTSFWKTAKGLSGYNFTHSGEEITF